MDATKTLTKDLTDCTWIHARTGQDLAEGQTVSVGTRITKIEGGEPSGPFGFIKWRFVAHVDDERLVFETYEESLPIE